MKYAIIFLFTFALLFPLYWMIQGSFQDIGGLIKVPPNWIPRQPTVMNYVGWAQVSTRGYDFWGKHPDALLRWTFNTFAIFGLKCGVGILLIAPAGYAFAVYNFRWKNALFIIFIIGIFIGPGITIIPHFVNVKRLGISGTWWAVILPGAYTPVGVYMFRNYVETIPYALIDSARIDGAGEFKILFRIMMPLCLPVIGVIVVLTALGTLQDYIWTLLMVPKMPKTTLMVGIIQTLFQYQMIGSGRNPIGMALAGGVILFMPLFLVFLFCQKFFIKGLTLGGIK